MEKKRERDGKHERERERKEENVGNSGPLLFDISPF